MRLLVQLSRPHLIIQGHFTQRGDSFRVVDAFRKAEALFRLFAQVGRINGFLHGESLARLIAADPNMDYRLRRFRGFSDESHQSGRGSRTLASLDRQWLLCFGGSRIDLLVEQFRPARVNQLRQTIRQ
jgi:hypothetical protein